MELLFDKDTVVPGDIVQVEAVSELDFKRVEVSTPLLSDVFDVDIISFLKKEKFELERTIRVNNSLFDSERQLEITDDITSELPEGERFKFSLPEFFYFKVGSQNLAKIYLYYEDETVDGKIFECYKDGDDETDYNYKITLQIEVLKQEPVDVEFVGEQKEYTSNAKLFSFKINDASKVSKIRV